MEYPITYKKITTQIFEKVVVAQQQPSVLVFGAEWSGNSEIVDNMMKRLSQEFNTGIQFFKVDHEEQNNISKFLGVNSVPTTVLVKEGEVVDLIKGFLPAKRVREKIKESFQENEIE